MGEGEGAIDGGRMGVVEISGTGIVHVEDRTQNRQRISIYLVIIVGEVQRLDRQVWNIIHHAPTGIIHKAKTQIVAILGRSRWTPIIWITPICAHGASPISTGSQKGCRRQGKRTVGRSP